jgi:hypothetical protein
MYALFRTTKHLNYTCRVFISKSKLPFVVSGSQVLHVEANFVLFWKSHLRLARFAMPKRLERTGIAFVIAYHPQKKLPLKAANLKN